MEANARLKNKTPLLAPTSTSSHTKTPVSTTTLVSSSTLPSTHVSTSVGTHKKKNKNDM
jgi:hypothetical protein